MVYWCLMNYSIQPLCFNLKNSMNSLANTTLATWKKRLDMTNSKMIGSIVPLDLQESTNPCFFWTRLLRTWLKYGLFNPSPSPQTSIIYSYAKIKIDDILLLYYIIYLIKYIKIRFFPLF
uniref:Uncharacterized protein n=1 Tax=Cacopsylla melanoneura TaxID=428564 RepID=A0A8D8Q324_9HEMI